MPSPLSRTFCSLIGFAGLVLASAQAAPAQTPEPIRIGVIGEELSVAGASLTRAAIMAAADINAQGGVNGRKIELSTYDNHSSASNSAAARKYLPVLPKGPWQMAGRRR